MRLLPFVDRISGEGAGVWDVPTEPVRRRKLDRPRPDQSSPARPSIGHDEDFLRFD
jgi:hypothetical protein